MEEHCSKIECVWVFLKQENWSIFVDTAVELKKILDLCAVCIMVNHPKAVV